MLKTYSELISLKSYDDRLKYLILSGSVGRETFGTERYLNQILYTSKEWSDFRRQVIIRDNACDLADLDHPIIKQKIIVHHINPLTVDDLLKKHSCIFDMDNVITVTHMTHEIIHYGFFDDQFTGKRFENDTCPWKL